MDENKEENTKMRGEWVQRECWMDVAFFCECGKAISCLQLAFYEWLKEGEG